MSNQAAHSSIVHDLASLLVDSKPQLLPEKVRLVASRQTLDSIGCGIGGIHHEAAEIALEVILAMGGTPECTLFGQATKVSAANAAFYNSTVVRTLDCNDIFFQNGPLGHPSDNIPVAIAIAERQQASGLDYLNAVSLGYELNWRVLEYIRSSAMQNAIHWDYVSTGGLVASAMSGLLLNLDKTQMANALSIAGVQGFTLPSVRRGNISMLKASAGAFAAQHGVMAALLAKAGMTGPTDFVEGGGGLSATLALNDVDNLRERLAGPIDHWHILDASSKPFPAIGTSQSAISATLYLRSQHALNPLDIQSIDIKLPDVQATRQQIIDPGFLRPTTREAADHSLPFLVAVALEDGQVGLAQFENDRWLRETTSDLMRKVSQAPDGSLNAHTSKGYPAVVTIQTRDGQRYVQEVLNVPGSPDAPLTNEELVTKFRSYTSSHMLDRDIEHLAHRLLDLKNEPNMAPLVRYFAGDATA